MRTAESRPIRVSMASGRRPLPSARSREVGVATEMFLTKGEQVSDDADGPPDYACCGSAGPVGRHTLAAIPALRITPHDAAAVHVRLVFAQGFATGARLVLNSGLGPS